MKISENKFWFIFFIALFLFYYVTYYIPFNFSQLCGDGVCQIAYWRSLFDVNLRGSTGASATKPGWAIILGICHEFYNLLGQSNLPFKLVLVFFITSLVWIVTRISSEIGGRGAGFIALLYALAIPTFFDWYKLGSSMLFCLPFIMFGLWLYSNKKEKLGILLLIISIFFRIESSFIVLLICFIEFLKRNYKKSLLIALSLGIAVSLWLGFVYTVQGDLKRMDSGVGVGYIEHKEINFLNIYNSIRCYIENWQLYLSSLNHDVILAIFFVIGIVFIKEIRIYASIIGLFIGHLLFVIFFGGPCSYMEMLDSFSIAIGFGSFFYFLKKFKNRVIPKELRFYFIILIYMLIIGFAINKGLIERLDQLYISKKIAPEEYAFMVNARDIIDRNLIPKASRVLTEDDIIYSLVANLPPHYFKKMYALPFFNMCDNKEQERILKNIDFIYISKLGHVTFFLIDDQEMVKWKKDAFRENITRLFKTGGSFKMYGVTFRLLEESGYGYLIKVKNKEN